MNLKEIINYRNTCIVCDHALELHVQNKKKTQAILKDNSLEIDFNSGKSIIFNFDNSFNPVKINKSLFNPIRIAKICGHCNRNMGSVEDYGKTSFIELLYESCYYTFDILPDIFTNQYLVSFNSEYVSSINNNVLYHLEESHHLKESMLLYGDTQTQAIGNMMKKTMPMINMESIRNKEDFFSKVKLYAAFS